jgi:hypothetical protein
MSKSKAYKDLLFGELYCNCESIATKFFGVAIKKLDWEDEYQFLTFDGVKIGKAKYCTKVFEKNTLLEHRPLIDEARGK